MKSEELQTELEKLERRRGELDRDRAATQNDLDAAREDLVQGKARASEAVVAAQSKLTALTEAVVALDRRIDAKRTELAAAEAEERREAEFEKMLQVAQQAEAYYKEYVSLRERVNEALKTHAEEMHAGFYRLLAARNEWVRMVENKNYGELDLDGLRARGVDLTAVRIQWDSSIGTKHDVRLPHNLPHVYPFGNALPGIFLLWAEAKKEALEAEKVA